MSDDETGDGQRAVDLLQEIGLKEYEARSFVALTAIPEATARAVSERSGVPRPRVYDAMRALESRGLVETQHTSPQKYRAIPITEAVDILRSQYESRFEALDEALRTVETEQQISDPPTQEVWSLSGVEAVQSRTVSVVSEADDELVLLLADESVLSEELFDGLNEAHDRGIDVFVGLLDETTESTVRTAVPNAEVFRSELGWLRDYASDEETRIGRLLLADRNVLLVSSLGPHQSPRTESAVFAKGLGNGLVVIARRLLRAGLGNQSQE